MWRGSAGKVFETMKRNVIAIINDSMPEFSKGQKRIAKYVIENYDKAAYITAAKLGVLADVSESTVVRFANELGFDGYPDMQRALQEYIRTKLTAVQRVEVTDTRIGDSDVLDKVLASDIDKIKGTLENIDKKSFAAAVDAIINAKRIYIIGVRSSSSLAGFLNFNFRMIFDDVRFVQTTSGSEMFEQIMQIKPDDVMIAISFPRYSSRIINAVEFARNAKANVVALTDTKESPIAPFADELLLAESDMASFVDSLVAPLSIINAIIVAVAKKKKAELTERLNILENIWDEYDVYDKNRG